MRLCCRLTILALSLFVCAAASAQAQPKSLVVILLPRTSLSSWLQADAPHLHQIIATGALAVMNTRTARLPSDHVRETLESAALTLGAGSRAAGGPEIVDFAAPESLNAQASVADGALYARRMGHAAPPGRWVNVEWPRVLRENKNQGYDLQPGNLGDALMAHHVTIVAAGGCLAFPMACMSDGTVRVSPALLSSDRGCTVIDAGSAVPAADAFIGSVMARTTADHGRLIIVSPSINDADFARGRRLAPVVVWGPGVSPGLLYSPSTHRAGLVVNTDFASVVTSYFGATDTDPWLATQPFGHPWRTVPSANALTTVRNIENEAYAQADTLRVLPAVALTLGIVVLAGAALMMTGRFYPWTSLLPIIAIDALAVSGSEKALLIWFCGLMLIAVFLRQRLTLNRILFLNAAYLTALLTGDMLVGDPLMRHSLLGYSAVEGARYYGMGNEAMGALVGAALVAATLLWSRGTGSRWIAGIGLALIAILLGSSLAGAKAGGLLVAVASFVAFLWTITGQRWTRRTILALMVAMLLALAAASLGDLMHRSSPQSHMGQAAERIRIGGWHEALDIITRKLAVETRLLYHSAWACPLWASVIGLFVWRRKRSFAAKSAVHALMNGGMTAIIVCLLVNDAGVVAGALCGVIILSSLIILETKKSPRFVEMTSSP
jgi:hypothetical protein